MSEDTLLECLKIATDALEEIGEGLAPVEDFELIQLMCAEALLEIKRKQVLCV